MNRGKVERRLMRARAHLRPRREPTARVVHVTSEGELVTALRAASWWNTSRARRLELQLAPGTYHHQLELVDGVDLSGAGQIVWDGPGDTILTHGSDAMLAGVTVQHLGHHPGYALHADAPCPSSTLRLHQVHLSSESKPALGAGLFGGQRLEARDSTFSSSSYAAIHLHPWNQQGEPMAATFTRCSAVCPEVGVMWNQIDSGQPDELHWHGDVDAAIPFGANAPPPVFAFDVVAA